MAEIAHCREGASGAYRWTKCASSLAMEDHYANNSSPEAEEGTLAHSLMEAVLNTGKPATDFIHWVQNDFDVIEKQKEREEPMAWADYIHNTRNLPSVNYVDEGLGPNIVIPRKETYDQILDEFDQLEIFMEKEKEQPLKEKGGVVRLRDWLLDHKKKKFAASGVEMPIKLAKSYRKEIDRIGTRIMRDYPMLELFEEVCSNHLSNVKEEDD